MPEQKTILLASANVLNNQGYLRHLQEERRKILDVLHPSKIRQEIHIEREIEVSFGELFNQFNTPGYFQRPINLLHYSGHSTEEELILEDAVEGNKTISAQQLADFLKLQPRLEVVFLNSCCSASIGELLLKSGIGAVIETTTAVGDVDAARFATWVYQGLHAGKSLEQSFNQAIILYEEEICHCFRIESTERGISGFHLDKDTEKCAWKLVYHDKAFVETWYLVNRISSQGFYNKEITTRILAIYENENGDGKYYEPIENLFLHRPDTFVYTLGDLMMEEERDKLLGETQCTILFISAGFPGFWNRLGWLKPALQAMNLYFIGCDGDVEKAYSDIIQDLELNAELPAYPPLPLTLEKLSKIESLEVIVNKLVAKNILAGISTDFAGSAKVLREELDNLNFSKQRRPFESDDKISFRFGKYNLVLVEGSPHCAQELLIKRLLLYVANTSIDKNIKRHIISIGKNVFNALTLEELNQQLVHTLLGIKINLGIEQLRETIAQKIDQEDLVIVMNDVFQENGDCLPVFREFWNELVARLPPVLNHRLFLFVIHKACKESKNHWHTEGFISDPPLFNVRLLDAIEPLTWTDLNAWRANTNKRFPEGHFFDPLIQEQAQQILQVPYMSKAIAKICALMKCPGVSSEVLKI